MGQKSAHYGHPKIFVQRQKTTHLRPSRLRQLATAASGINIAKMHLGRDSHGGQAIVLLEIDETPTDEDLAKLRVLPNIDDVRYLQFPTL